MNIIINGKQKIKDNTDISDILWISPFLLIFSVSTLTTIREVDLHGIGLIVILILINGFYIIGLINIVRNSQSIYIEINKDKIEVKKGAIVLNYKEKEIRYVSLPFLKSWHGRYDITFREGKKEISFPLSKQNLDDFKKLIEENSDVKVVNFIRF